MMICFVCVCVIKERAADDSKEVEGFQQLLLARTQVHSGILSTGSNWQLFLSRTLLSLL